MATADKTIIAVLLIGIALMAIGGARQYYDSTQAAEWQKAGRPLSVSTSVFLSGRHVMRGNAAAKYTLVEFADYQCPPCRASQEDIQDALTAFKTELRFDFRNFPLTDIHHNALEAAKIAETGRHFGCFWKIHDQLMAVELELPRNHEFFLSLLQKDGVNPIEAEKFYRVCSGAIVKGDVRLGTEIGVHGTPSFFLCCPNGQIVQLTSLSQLRYWLPS